MFFRIDANVPKAQNLVTEEHAVIVVENWYVNVKNIRGAVRNSNMPGKLIARPQQFIIHKCLLVAYHLCLPSQTRLARVTTVRLAKELMFQINMVTHLRKGVPPTVSYEWQHSPRLATFIKFKNLQTSLNEFVTISWEATISVVIR